VVLETLNRSDSAQRALGTGSNTSMAAYRIEVILLTSSRF
jgi:hypothetical protein